MGDMVAPAGGPTEISRQTAAAGSTVPQQTQASYVQVQPGAENVQGYPPVVQQQFGNSQQAFSSQLDMAQNSGVGRGGVGPYNMTGMTNALPQQGGYRSSPYAHQRFGQATGSSAMAAGPVPMVQYAMQGPTGGMSNTQYFMPSHMVHPHTQQYYANPMSSTPQHGHMGPARQTTGYYANSTHQHPHSHQLQQQQHHHLHQQHAPSPATGQYYYGPTPPYAGHAAGLQPQMMAAQYAASGGVLPQADPRPAQLQGGDQLGNSLGPSEKRSMPLEGTKNLVRGPPRKPRQNGHAIWLGNLPPQTDLMSLVHHVCKETKGLDSLFLISKSNCAFANFKDEATCAAAQQYLHDSKFQSVRLVSRLRKSTVEGATGVTAPTGPAAALSSTHQHHPPQGNIPQEPEEAPPALTSGQGEGGDLEGNPHEDETPSQASAQEVPHASGPPASRTVETAVSTAGAPRKDRYFILKSLTVEDLELSVRTGIWATQLHNEATLNKAYEAADNVYLIFSANKSGEYFGYARMTSPVNEDPAAAIEFAPKAQSVSDVDLPKAIPTEATAFAPRGRIIDDSARGTIFWEADLDDTTATAGGDEAAASDEAAKSDQQDGVQVASEGGGTEHNEENGGDDHARRGGEEKASSPKSSPPQPPPPISEGGGGGGGAAGVGNNGAGEAQQQAWGKPFKLEWLSTARLPFFRTRGLRNPWNANREVKIARDGTELEPLVGRRLIGLFNNRAAAVTAAQQRVGVGVQGVMMVTGGYPPPAAAHSGPPLPPTLLPPAGPSGMMRSAGVYPA